MLEQEAEEAEEEEDSSTERLRYRCCMSASIKMQVVVWQDLSPVAKRSNRRRRRVRATSRSSGLFPLASNG